MNTCKNPLCNNQTKNKYCSRKCPALERRAEKLAQWLLTGKAWVSTNQGHYIRDYLFSEQKGKCKICTLSSEWQGKELSFVLDHIDGNATNSSRDNLRLICPNCDSQLITYKARNKGRGMRGKR